ncbi:unnamed protein product [Prunus brigantina]
MSTSPPRTSNRTPVPKARPPSPRTTSEDYSSEAIPSRDPAIRLLFQRIQRMEDDRTRSQVPNWGKLQPGPFTERIACTPPMIRTRFGREKTNPYGSMLRASVTSTRGVRKRMTGQLTAPSRVAHI